MEELLEFLFEILITLFSGVFRIFIGWPLIFVGAVIKWFIKGRKPLLWDLLQDNMNGVWGLLIVLFVVGCIVLTMTL